MKPLFDAGLFFLFFINRAVAQQPLFYTVDINVVVAAGAILRREARNGETTLDQ